MDETLIKATNDASKFPDGLYDERCVLDIQELQKKDIYLSYRPYLFEMLSQLKKNFELILFTASKKVPVCNLYGMYPVFSVLYLAFFFIWILN